MCLFVCLIAWARAVVCCSLVFPLFGRTVLCLGALGGGLTYKAQFLEKPSTGDFQLFHNGHPMELYEMIWKESFFQGGLSGSSARAYYPVTFVWGLEPTDTGDKRDPADHGEPVWTDLDARSQVSGGERSESFVRTKLMCSVRLLNNSATSVASRMRNDVNELDIRGGDCGVDI